MTFALAAHCEHVRTHSTNGQQRAHFIQRLLTHITNLGPQGERHLCFISAHVLFANGRVFPTKRKLKHQTPAIPEYNYFHRCTTLGTVTLGWGVIRFHENSINQEISGYAIQNSWQLEAVSLKLPSVFWKSRFYPTLSALHVEFGSTGGELDKLQSFFCVSSALLQLSNDFHQILCH